MSWRWGAVQCHPEGLAENSMRGRGRVVHRHAFIEVERDGAVPFELFEQEARIDILERPFDLRHEILREGLVRRFKHGGEGKDQRLPVDFGPNRIALLRAVERVVADGRKKLDARLLIKPSGRLDE